MYIKFYYITLADVKILLHCKMKLLLQLVVSVRKHYSVRYIGPVLKIHCVRCINPKVTMLELGKMMLPLHCNNYRSLHCQCQSNRFCN